MSIARGSTLDNSYRYVTLAIDFCQGHQPCGVISHASQEKGDLFRGYRELIYRVDKFFQGKGYPMRSMEQRTFLESKEEVLPFVRRIPSAPEEEARGGRKITFRLYVSQRYYANWQGRLLWLEQQKTYEYNSFLELMHIMNGILKDDIDKDDINDPVAENPFVFNDINELIERLDMFFSSPDSGNSAVGMYGGEDERATFGIRLLFRENATWQGSVFWKETGRQRYFRSFLELIMIIDIAIDNRVVWAEGKKQQAIAL